MSTVTPPKRLSAVVFGYGPRVGRGVVQKLLAEGFTVAAGNRHPDYEAAKREGYHAFYIDCTDSDNFTSVAEKVRVDLLGEEGYFNVVIYNAYGVAGLNAELATYNPDPLNPSGPDPLNPGTYNPLAIDFKTLKVSMEAEINSFYAACLFAIAGFDQLKVQSPDATRTFIAGGNACPWLPAHDIFLTLFIGKRAQSYLMEYFAAKLTPKTGHQFYFAYQVVDNTNLIPPNDDMSGEAHGSVYNALIGWPKQEHWSVRFDKSGTILVVPE